jgi:hypothetical protein
MRDLTTVQTVAAHLARRAVELGMYRPFTGLVVRAYRATLTLKEAMRREFLPAEFGDDAEIQAAVFDPIEEIWRHRVRHFR